MNNDVTKVAVRLSEVGFDLSTYRSRAYDVHNVLTWPEFVNQLIDENEIYKPGIYLLYSYDRICSHCGGARKRIHTIYRIEKDVDGKWTVLPALQTLNAPTQQRIVHWPPK